MIACNKLLCSSIPDDLPPGFEVGPDGNFYGVSTNKLNRDEAKQACELTPGSHLAVPKTELEALTLSGYKSNYQLQLSLSFNQVLTNQLR